MTKIASRGSCLEEYLLAMPIKTPFFKKEKKGNEGAQKPQDVGSSLPFRRPWPESAAVFNWRKKNKQRETQVNIWSHVTEKCSDQHLVFSKRHRTKTGACTTKKWRRKTLLASLTWSWNSNVPNLTDPRRCLDSRNEKTRSPGRRKLFQNRSTSKNANTFFSPHQQSVLQGTTFRPGCPSHFQVSQERLFLSPQQKKLPPSSQELTKRCQKTERFFLHLHKKHVLAPAKKKTKKGRRMRLKNMKMAATVLPW